MKKIVLLLVIFNIALLAQYNGHKFGISASVSYTTSSKLFYFPKSEDPFLRDQSEPLDDITSFAFEVRYRVSEAIIAGFNVGYVEHSGYIKAIPALGSDGVVSLEANDGFEMFPFELSLYYYLPFSVEKFKFYMGGGAGYYFGNHTRSLGTLEVENLKRETAFGIHVLVGMDYLVTDYFSLRGEMKFRDPDYEVTNKYKSDTISYRGEEYTVSGSRYDTGINIDGVMFTFGIAWHFSIPGV